MPTCFLLAVGSLRHDRPEQIDEVAQPPVDDLPGLLTAGLGVRLQGDVELVALEMTSFANAVGGLGQHARAKRVEDVLDPLVEAFVEQLLRLRAMAGREHAGAGLVDDAQGSEWTSSLPSPWMANPFTFSRVWPVQMTTGMPASWSSVR